jgi:AraC family transcriptional regulator
MSAEEKRAAFSVRLIDIPERQVAYIRVTNGSDLDRVLAAVKTMIEWAKSQDIFSQGILFGMTVDDLHVTPNHLYRYEVCLASSIPFKCTEGISKLKMPAMRYAVITVSGDIHKVATAWDYLYRNWLINSAYESEHAPALEVFLDKESATDWLHFELELCLPVRKPAEMRGEHKTCDGRASRDCFNFANRSKRGTITESMRNGGTYDRRNWRRFSVF